MKTTVGQITDRGLSTKREVNEDNLLALPKRGLFLVADGVGGRQGGQVASQTVVDVFTRVFSQEQTDDLHDLIAGTIDLCNQKIFEDAENNPELHGMATTIALLAVEGDRAIVAHVGDSRVYRFDDQGLICLTEDHSEVNEALRTGVITEEQAATYPRRNVINRALGAEAYVEPDILEIDVDDRTSFLLCSDGVTRHIADDEIVRLLSSGRRPQAICETMKDLCYAGGAEDNLTAIIVDIGEREYVEEPTRPAPKMARANAATGGPTTRSTGRIEVDLTEAPPVESRPERPPQPKYRSGPLVDKEERKTSQTQLVSNVGAESDAAGTMSRGVSRNFGRNLPQKGELSNVMKLSMLFATLLAGVIIGSLFGRPIGNRFDSLFGRRDILQGVDRPPADAEVSAAYARFLEGKAAEGRQQLSQVLAVKPNHAEAHYYLGRIDYAEGKYEDAVNHLSQAFKDDPNLPDIRIHLAMAYISIGQARTARDILQQVITPSSPTPTPTPSPVLAPSASPASGKPVG